jgi:hypothetical protein
MGNLFLTRAVGGGAAGRFAVTFLQALTAVTRTTRVSARHP